MRASRNIVSGGPSIIRKPGSYRSNLELTNSLRSNFLEAKTIASQDVESNGHANGSALNGDASKNAPLAWTEREGSTIYVPRIDWSAAGLQEEPSQYDTTVKLFFLPTAPAEKRAQYVKDALDLVLKELALTSIDLLVVSFPGMSFDGDCEWEADKLNATQGNDEEEAATWHVVEELHKQGVVKKLGVAEFGSVKLARFLKRASIAPSVNQINIKNCCNVPPPLIELANERRIELLTHSDCTDILPEGTLREILAQGAQGAGILADRDAQLQNGSGPLQGNLIPQWVVKYTAVVRDRGVIENKGYFAGAELVPSST